VSIDLFNEQSELFGRLENTGNHYSYYKKGRKFVYFSTGGWSDNEELISELEQKPIFKLLLIKWETGGHYTFKIIKKKEVLKNEC
jgi:hypothetical protein